MRKILITAGLAIAVVAAGLGIAHAGIPGSDAVIRGCYKLNNPAKGAVIVVDGDLGETCPNGYASVPWYEAPPDNALWGVEIHVDDDIAVAVSSEIQQVTLTCPAGEIVVTAAASLYAGGNNLLPLPPTAIPGPPDRAYFAFVNPFSDPTTFRGYWTCAKQFVDAR